MLFLQAFQVELKRNIQGIVNRVGYRIEKIRDYAPESDMDVLSLVLRDLMQTTPKPFVFQVGANDGSTADPIHRYITGHGLPALLVEPQPTIFDRLKHAYAGHPQVQFEQALIASGGGERDLFVVRTDGAELPPWCYQIASVDRELVVRLLREHQAILNLPEDVEALVRAVRIAVRSIEDLLRVRAIEQVDVLVIDTMGFDYEVLKLYPFATHKPKVVSFEDTFLSFDDTLAAYELLQGMGYGLCKVGVDTVGYLGVQRRLVRRGSR
jgi:FkbM family methyltransferase